MSKYVDQSVDVIKEVLDVVDEITEEVGLFEEDWFGLAVDEAIARVAAKYGVNKSTISAKLTRESEIDGINNYKELLYDFLTGKNDKLKNQILDHIKDKRGDDNRADVAQKIKDALKP